MDSNKKIIIQILNGKCIISECDLNNSYKGKNDLIMSPNSIDDISMTISQSIDSKNNLNIQKNSNIKKEDLEISYKSIFFSENKSENKINNYNFKPDYVKNIDFQKEQIISNEKTSVMTKEDNDNFNKKLLDEISITPFKERDENIKENKNEIPIINLKIKQIQIKNTMQDKNNKKSNFKTQYFPPNQTYQTNKKKDFIDKFIKKMTNNKNNKNQSKTNHSYSSSSRISIGLNNNLFDNKSKKKIRSNSSVSCLLLSKNNIKKSISLEKNAKNKPLENKISNSEIKTSSFVINSPINLKQKIEQKNSILKNIFFYTGNKNISYTPNTNSTERNKKRIINKTPSNQVQQKLIIPYLNKKIKTSPSPPKISKPLSSACNISGLKKKPVYTINNFSNYIKKSQNKNMKKKDNQSKIISENKKIIKKVNGVNLFQKYS
jgi:hypothetical protein